MSVRLLKRTGAALAAVVKAPSAFQAHRAAAVQAAADDAGRWLAAVQAAAGGVEPDAAAVADLVAIGERLGLGDVEAQFNADVQRLRQLNDAERQLSGLVPPRSGETVAKELKECQARVQELRHEQARLAGLVQGRGALLREVEALRGGLPARLKGCAK